MRFVARAGIHKMPARFYFSPPVALAAPCPDEVPVFGAAGAAAVGVPLRALAAAAF
jgi:hypothetical protein